MLHVVKFFVFRGKVIFDILLIIKSVIDEFYFDIYVGRKTEECTASATTEAIAVGGRLARDEVDGE